VRTLYSGFVSRLSYTPRAPRNTKRDPASREYLSTLSNFFNEVTYSFSTSEYELLDKSFVLGLFKKTINKYSNEDYVIYLRHRKTGMLVVACLCCRMVHLKRPSGCLLKLESEYKFKRLKFSFTNEGDIHPALAQFRNVFFATTRSEQDTILSYITVCYRGMWRQPNTTDLLFTLLLTSISKTDGKTAPASIPQVPLSVIGETIEFPPSSSENHRGTAGTETRSREYSLGPRDSPPPSQQPGNGASFNTLSIFKGLHDPVLSFESGEWHQLEENASFMDS